MTPHKGQTQPMLTCRRYLKTEFTLNRQVAAVIFDISGY